MCKRYGILLCVTKIWTGIEVVITALTRNQVVLTGSWVRIPPCPPIMRVCSILQIRIYFSLFTGSFHSTHTNPGSPRYAKGTYCPADSISLFLTLSIQFHLAVNITVAFRGFHTHIIDAPALKGIYKFLRYGKLRLNHPFALRVLISIQLPLLGQCSIAQYIL